MSHSGLIDSVMILLRNQVELSSEFVQGKWCEINSREAFHMNVSGICVPMLEHKILQKGWDLQEIM